jgi:hypothetical protein
MAITPEKTSIAAPQQPKSPADVGMMDAVRETNGKGSKRMNAIQIIEKAAAPQLSGGMTMDTFMKKLTTWVKQPNNRLIQIGNTVFLTTLMDQQIAQVSIMNADSEDKLIQNIVGVTKALKSAGMKKIVGYANDPRYVDMAKKTQLPFRVSQGQKVVGGKGVPTYNFELDL